MTRQSRVGYFSTCLSSQQCCSTHNTFSKRISSYSIELIHFYLISLLSDRNLIQLFYFILTQSLTQVFQLINLTRKIKISSELVVDASDLKTERSCCPIRRNIERCYQTRWSRVEYFSTRLSSQECCSTHNTFSKKIASPVPFNTYTFF